MNPIKESRDERFRSIQCVGLEAIADKEQAPSIVTRHSLAESKKKRTNILLAEDNIVNQQLALAILEKLGYGADVAIDGKEAIGAIERDFYDLILMDVQMPGMDGIKATKLIRQEEKETGVHIPIIAMTAHAMQGDRERCIEAGMDDYVSKPIDTQKFSDAIEKQLSHAKSRGSETVATTRPEANGAFDRPLLLERLDGDEGLFNEIMGVYLEDVPRLIGKIKEAEKGKDALLVEREGHTLKGASANVGALAIQDIALQIEMTGKSEMLEDVGSLIGQAEMEFEKLKTSLEDLGIQP